MHTKQPKDDPPRNNPYQLLIIALPFFIAGIFLTFHKGLVAIGHMNLRGGGGSIEVQPEEVAHFYGIVLLVMAFSIAAFYFYLRRQIRLEEEFPRQVGRRQLERMKARLARKKARKGEPAATDPESSKNRTGASSSDPS